MFFIVAVTLWLAEPAIGRFISGWTYMAPTIIVMLFTLPRLGALSWGTISHVARGLSHGSGLRVAKVMDVLSSILSGYLQGASSALMIAALGLASGPSITVSLASRQPPPPWCPSQ